MSDNSDGEAREQEQEQALDEQTCVYLLCKRGALGNRDTLRFGDYWCVD